MPSKKKVIEEEKKETIPKEESGLKVGQVFADVKIVEINPKLERSIGFVRVKRALDGPSTNCGKTGVVAPTGFMIFSPHVTRRFRSLTSSYGLFALGRGDPG